MNNYDDLLVFLYDIVIFFYKLPEVYLFFSCSILLFFGIFYRVKNNERLFYNITVLLILIIFFALLIYINIMPLCVHNFVLTSDYFLYLSKLLFIFLLLILVLGSIEAVKREPFFEVEYLFIFGIASLGLLLFINCNDFLYLYLIIELVSLSLYILTLINKYSNYSTESGLKYFILGSLASSMLLFGISLYYGIVGTTLFNENLFLSLLLNYPKEYIYGFAFSISFISCGLFFKIGLFPYFIWLADVYTGVHLYITAFFSTIPKIAILIFISKLYFFLFYNYVFFWGWCISLCVILSIIIGTLGALYQISIKRLWAYSAVAHVGYIMSNVVSISILNLYSLLFYLFIYILISLSFFFLLFILKNEKKKFIAHLNDLTFFLNSNKVGGIFLCFTLFSLAGIPPLAGFISKINVLLSLINTSEFIILFFLIVFSLISSIYYLRFIKKLFFNEIIIFTLLDRLNYIHVSYLIIFLFYINVFFFLFFKYLVFIYIVYIEIFIGSFSLIGELFNYNSSIF